MPALTDEQKVKVAGNNGIILPALVMDICRDIGLPFYIACTYLEQETSGGHHWFGSDEGKPGLMRGIEMIEELGDRIVTEDRYKIYRMQRAELGAQGIGPLQATFPDWQDEIDAAGGCWVWEVNVEKGLTLIRDFKAAGRTWDETALRWNGGQAFVDHNRELRNKWRERLAS